MVSAFMQAGVPAEAFGLYPGGHDAGGAIMTKTSRSMIFGSAQTVAQHAGNPKVQAHGPGFSKILIGDDVVDDWEDYLDLMVESVLSNSGRSCINCSGIWASRHTREIAQCDRRANRSGRSVAAERSQRTIGSLHRARDGHRHLRHGPARSRGIGSRGFHRRVR